MTAPILPAAAVAQDTSSSSPRADGNSPWTLNVPVLVGATDLHSLHHRLSSCIALLQVVNNDRKEHFFLLFSRPGILLSVCLLPLKPFLLHEGVSSYGYLESLQPLHTFAKSKSIMSATLICLLFCWHAWKAVTGLHCLLLWREPIIQIRKCSLNSYMMSL